LRPAEPQALRAVARFLSRMHQPEARRQTSLTRDDVRDAAMIAIIAGDTSRADVSARELIGSHARTNRLVALRATLLANRLKGLCSEIF